MLQRIFCATNPIPRYNAHCACLQLLAGFIRTLISSSDMQTDDTQPSSHSLVVCAHQQPLVPTGRVHSREYGFGCDNIYYYCDVTGLRPCINVLFFLPIAHG